MKGKGCLIAVLIVILVLIIVAAVFYFNRGKIADWFADKMVDQILANLPVDYDEAMARKTMDRFIAAIKEGRVEREEVKEVLDLFQAAWADKKLETHEVDELMKAMQEAVR
jgi:Zn-dependent protease with chaperone function